MVNTLKAPPLTAATDTPGRVATTIELSEFGARALDKLAHHTLSRNFTLHRIFSVDLEFLPVAMLHPCVLSMEDLLPLLQLTLQVEIPDPLHPGQEAALNLVQIVAVQLKVVQHTRFLTRCNVLLRPLPPDMVECLECALEIIHIVRLGD